MDNKSLKINIGDFYSAELGYQKIYSISAVMEGDSEIKYLQPVDATITLEKIDDGILANLNIKSQVELICSRCAKEFKKNLGLKIERIYSFEPSENEDYVIESSKFIDFTPLIHDEIILSMPIKILCKQNCEGIGKE